jgi:hypothetical protein
MADSIRFVCLGSSGASISQLRFCKKSGIVVFLKTHNSEFLSIHVLAEQTKQDTIRLLGG